MDPRTRNKFALYLTRQIWNNEYLWWYWVHAKKTLPVSSETLKVKIF